MGAAFLKAAEIGVSVNDGIVTLSGTVDSFLKKSEAEDAAKGVAGVKAVVEKIDINFGTWGVTADSQIAAAVLNAIKWNWDVPGEKIKIRVEKGWVTLEGELEWNYQRDTAKTVVSRLNAVKGVSNNITIKSESFDEIEKRDIEHALARNWSLNDREIRVKVSGSTVTLSGLVDSLYQKDRAGKIAWNAPGVRSVDNELVVEYSDTMVE